MNAIKVEYLRRLVLLTLLNGCLFSTFHRPVRGQVTNTSVSSSMPICDTACPVNKTCLKDNVTVFWDYINGDNYQCKTYKSCYGTSSDYVENTPSTSFFPVRLNPVDIARGSEVYFVSKDPFRAYNVTREQFFSCSEDGGQEVSRGFMTAMKVPFKFLSSLGYRYFIAAGNPFYSCTFGLRLHMNVKDATNCSGQPSLPPGSHLCSGKGQCISDSFTAGMYCECCDGYTGRYCEEYNACYNDPCIRGNCTDTIAGHGEDFNCSCLKGYTGQRCDIDIDDCVPNRCLNGAICFDGVNEFECLCQPGYHGTYCQHVSNLCEKLQPCKNNGVCVRVGPKLESYKCQCAPGFTGQNCSMNATESSSTFIIQPSTGTSINHPSSMVHTISYSPITEPSSFPSLVISDQPTSATFLSSISQTSIGPVTSDSLKRDQTSRLVSESRSDQETRPKTSLYLSVSEMKDSSRSQLSLTVESSPIPRSISKSITTIKSYSIRDTQHSTSFHISSVQHWITSQGITVTSTSGTTDVSVIRHTSQTQSFSKSDFYQSKSKSMEEHTTVDVSSPMLSSSQATLQTSGATSSEAYRISPTFSFHSDKGSFQSPSSSGSKSSQYVPTMEVVSFTSAEPAQSSLTMQTSMLPKTNAVSSLLPFTTFGGTTVAVRTSSGSLHRTGIQSSVSPTPVISPDSLISSIVVTSKIPFSSRPAEISPSMTHVKPGSTVLPTGRPPFENQTCADRPCGEHGVCRNHLSSGFELQFSCDCQYPTVGPICTTDLELHFPLFNGRSYIKHKPIIFGSSENKFVISFRTSQDGTILYSSHVSYRDFIKLEVLEGKVRFTIDAGDGVVSVTSSEVVAHGNTTAAVFGYNTESGTVFLAVNNGSVLKSTTEGKLRAVQLYHALYIGGIIPSTFTDHKPDVGVITPFVGCIRELEFNDRAILLSDALDWQNISECDLPACRALPCKNGGVCMEDVGDVNEYSCQCPYPYSGKNCEKKYACLVNVCNGGVCLNSTSGPRCLCAFGKGGVSCNQDLRVNIPSFTVTSGYSSFLQFTTPKGAVDQLDIRMEIKFSDDVESRKSALLFYVGLHDHLSVGSDGDYLALGVEDSRVLLQYNLGSGIAKITSQRQLSLDQEWFVILAGRKGRDGYLYIDNDDLQEGRSPPPLVALNVFGHMYLGGIPDVSQLNSEVEFKAGFRGTIKDSKIRTGSSNSWYSLTMKHSSNDSNELTVLTGLNVQNERVNACVSGACLNNGSCVSLGASYVCQCLPVWSGMMCNDSAIPCREYNPCQGQSTCRARDSGLTCDCPPGKAGKYCQHDINITTPYFQEYSYLSISLAKVNVQSTTSLTIGFSPLSGDAILFYITRDIKLLSGDFLSITLHDGFVFLIYNLGTGLAKCKSENTVHLRQRNDVTVTRDKKVSTLAVNGNRTSCQSPGPAVGLNVQSDFYVGGVPDLSQVQPIAYENIKDLKDYTGCVHDLTINGQSFELSGGEAVNGRNILNCGASQLVV